MTDTKFGCLPTVIGSLPHKDPVAACSVVARYLKDIPAWPQLPHRGFPESMHVQYGEGFPGLVIKEDSIYVDRSKDLSKPLQELYEAYLANDSEKYPMTKDHAAGFYSFLSLTNLSPKAVKGQVIGPISFGMTVTDDNRQAIIYDETLADAAAKLLRLKASWQEKRLSQICRDTIIFVDEPSLASFGSAYMPISQEKVIKLLEEVFSGISGLKGVHCCGNTDWSVLLKTSIDILNFDAYSYAQSLSLYPEEVKDFIARNKVVAWGIVPNEAEALAKETVASLKDRLEEAMVPFTRNGIRFKQLIEQGLITPSCGLARLPTEESAERALELLTELSKAVRKRYL